MVEMREKAVLGVILALLLMGMLAFVSSIQRVIASGTIYIRADGSIEPKTAPISSVDNISYTFTDDIYDSIVVERDDIVIDGAGYALQGSGSGNGIDLLELRSNVTIMNMEITAFHYGIYGVASRVPKIIQNNIAANNVGIYDFFGWRDAHISGNTVTGNSVGISLEGRDNIIAGNTITANSLGIEFASFNSNISGNHITDNGSGIYLYGWGPSRISGNNITGNDYGISAGGMGGNYVISGNTINANKYAGISMSYTTDNNITDNNITNNNLAGIYISDSAGNQELYHNNLVNNTEQVSFPPMGGPYNVWDDGYPSGGNYWDDYSGADDFHGPYQNETGSDGIGDIPYVILGDEDNRDSYPLMNPWVAELEDLLPPAINAVHRMPTTPNYEEDVVVSATITDNVGVGEALFFYTNDFSWHNVSMNRFGETFNATIPAQPYGTLVQYKIYANDTNGNWAETTTYSYTVADFLAPDVIVSQSPTHPQSSQSVTIQADAAEPVNASGIQTVLFHYRVNGGPWVNTTMVFNEELSLYESTIPQQQPNDLVEYFAKAEDNAGNTNTTDTYSYVVTLTGDVDFDGDVDGFDLTYMCGCYGATPGDPKWDEACDINRDGIIDGFDLTPACGNYGKTL